MVLCPTCNAEQTETSKFCSECGAALKPQYEATVAHGGGPTDDSPQSSISDSSQHGRFLPGTKVGDRYRIVSLVGKGGMGEVYRADDLRLRHTVALKFLPKELSEDHRRIEYLHTEVRLTRQVSHPSVCRVYDVGEAEGLRFLTMEYVDGEDLRSLLHRIGRLPQNKGVQIAQQLCAGLAAAHAKGVLHRDLKPANIMIDGRGNVRITDFGLAKLTEDKTDGEVVGTPAYMAPEQLARGEATVQSDLYSLGLILYKLFTGVAVHQTNTVRELLREHQESSPTKPSALVDDMDPEVERIILQCLEKEPQRRPKSAHEIAATLPGGDPLAAALAAGETPSPELVANAKEEGSLPRLVGVTFLLITLVAIVIWIAHKANLTVFPSTPVSALSTHAADLLHELGYDDLPPHDDPQEHSVQGLMRYDAYLAYIGRPGPPGWSLLDEQDWPPQYIFWKRWSDDGFQTRDMHWPWPSHIEPPQSTPGSVTVMLDTHDHLLALSIIPVPSLPSPTGKHELDVKDLFERAGLDINELEGPTEPTRPSPTHCDRVEEWTGQVPPESGGPFTIQVGWHHDRLVHFVIYWGWDEKGVLNQPGYDPQSFFSRIAYFFFGTAGILPVFLILAWRNVRLGRTDQRGALWYALLVLGGFFLRELASIRLGESGFIDLIDQVFDGRHLGHSLLHGLQAWLAYLAIEPYVRRMWPRSLVGWARFAKGRRRDPQVGREVLLGMLLGSLTLITAIVVSRLAWYFDWPHAGPLHDHPEALHNIAWFIASIIPSGVMLDIMTFYVWLVIIRQITGSEWAAVAVVTVLNAAILYNTHDFFGGQTAFDPATLIWVLVLSFLTVLAMVRLGLITAIMIVFTARVMLLTPMSVEFPSDFSTQMGLGLMTLVGLALFGFFVSLGGQPLVRELSKKS